MYSARLWSEKEPELALSGRAGSFEIVETMREDGKVVCSDCRGDGELRCQNVWLL